MKTDNNLEICNVPFAEIELKDAVAGTHTARPQAIPARAYDPLRGRIRDMRKIADYAPYSYQNDGWLFYEQAKFMADVTDDYAHRTAFSAFYPFYQRMGYEQLRTYFTWRTRVRGGEFPFVGASYLFLYLYELLSCIGVAGPRDALEKLEALYPHYREEVPALNQYFTLWVKDFQVYYGLAAAAAPGDAPSETAQTWMARSGYDISKSKFFLAENQGLVTDCVSAVFDALYTWCAAHDTTLDAVLVYDTRPRVDYWRPFSQALFYPWLAQADRCVPMPGGETYVCHNNRWTVERAAPFKGMRELAGFILRKMEAQLRGLYKFKTKLTADAATLKYAAKKLNEAGLTLTELERVIDAAVQEFYRAQHQVKVEVSTTRLVQIRTEAQDTQEKLTVEEDGGVALGGASPPEASVVIAPVVAAPVVVASPPPDSGWGAFFAALSALEKEALALLCRGEDLAAFSAAQGIMPEVLAESINEKALDMMGDNLLETDAGITLYADYFDDIIACL